MPNACMQQRQFLYLVRIFYIIFLCLVRYFSKICIESRNFPNASFVLYTTNSQTGTYNNYQNCPTFPLNRDDDADNYNHKCVCVCAQYSEYCSEKMSRLSCVMMVNYAGNFCFAYLR